MSDLPTVTQLIGGRARTKPQACLTPEIGEQPQQGSEPTAQVSILVSVLQVGSRVQVPSLGTNLRGFSVWKLEPSQDSSYKKLIIPNWE